MSRFSLKMVFPLLVVLLVLLATGVFLASTGLVTPAADALATEAAARRSADSLAADPVGTEPDSVTVAASNPATPEETAAIAAGEALFQGNCAQCHAINDVVVGPALGGVHQRRPEQWLISWVKNSSKMVASGDEYGVKIFNQYQKQQMPSFQLTDKEIRHILAYLKAQSPQSGAAPSGAVATK